MWHIFNTPDHISTPHNSAHINLNIVMAFKPNKMNI